MALVDSMLVKFDISKLSKLKNDFGLTPDDIKTIARAQRITDINDDTHVICKVHDGKLYILSIPRIRMLIERVKHKVSPDVSRSINLRHLIFETSPPVKKGNVYLLKLVSIPSFEKIDRYITNVDIVAINYSGELYYCVRDSISGECIGKWGLASLLRNEYDERDTRIVSDQSHRENGDRVVVKVRSRNVKFVGPVEFTVRKVKPEIDSDLDVPELFEAVVTFTINFYGKRISKEIIVRPEDALDYLVNYDDWEILLSDGRYGVVLTEYDEKYLPVIRKIVRELKKKNNEIVLKFVKKYEPLLSKLTHEVIVKGVNASELSQLKTLYAELVRVINELHYTHGFTTVYHDVIDNIIEEQIKRDLETAIETAPEKVFELISVTREDLKKELELMTSGILPKNLQSRVKYDVSLFVAGLFRTIVSG